jgi:hypothetical protein
MFDGLRGDLRASAWAHGDAERGVQLPVREEIRVLNWSWRPSSVN